MFIIIAMDEENQNNSDTILVTGNLPREDFDHNFDKDYIDLARPKPLHTLPEAERTRIQEGMDFEYFRQYRLSVGDNIPEATKIGKDLSAQYDFTPRAVVPDFRNEGLVAYDQARLEQLGYGDKTASGGAYQLDPENREYELTRDAKTELRAMDVDASPVVGRLTVDDLYSARSARANELLTSEQTEDYLDDMCDDRESGRSVNLAGSDVDKLNSVFEEAGESRQWERYEGEHIQGSILKTNSAAEQERISQSLSSAGILNVAGVESNAEGQSIIIVPDGHMDEVTQDDALQAVNLLEESRPDISQEPAPQQQPTPVAQPMSPVPAPS